MCVNTVQAADAATGQSLFFSSPLCLVARHALPDNFRLALTVCGRLCNACSRQAWCAGNGQPLWCVSTKMRLQGLRQAQGQVLLLYQLVSWSAEASPSMPSPPFTSVSGAAAALRPGKGAEAQPP